MIAELKEGRLSDGMTYYRTEKEEVDRNLLFDIAAVTNRYSGDAIGLLVSRSEVFEKSLYRSGTRKFFNDALTVLKQQGFIILTPFTVALTPSGFDCIYDI